MKKAFLLLTFIFALCGSTAAIADFTMAYGMPIFPDARLAVSDVFDSAGGDREESYARFGTKASRKDVINFYRKALKKAGFQASLSNGNANYEGFSAKRGRDRIKVSFKNQGDWVKADESEISIIAVYDK